MTYLEIGENNQFQIDGFKRYARITDTVNDDEIRGFVRSAVMTVQEIADVALVPCKIAIEGEGRCLQLWQPIVSTIDSVENLATGDDVKADCLVLGRVITMPYSGSWRIVYNTQPNGIKADELRPYVWKIAAALYDGDTEEEAKAKASIPASYVVH
jgi:hypothetical protein